MCFYNVNISQEYWQSRLKGEGIMTLKEFRTSQMLTQKQVAEKISVKRSTYSMWEIGASKPGWGNCKKLAVLYHTTPEIIANCIIRSKK